MWIYKYSRYPDYRRFFIRELVSLWKLEDLLKEAYVLVKHCNLTYSDVRSLTRVERVAFLQFLKEEQTEIERSLK